MILALLQAEDKTIELSQPNKININMLIVLEALAKKQNHSQVSRKQTPLGPEKVSA